MWGKKNPGFIYAVIGPGLTVAVQEKKKKKKKYGGVISYYSSMKISTQCSVAM